MNLISQQCPCPKQPVPHGSCCQKSRTGDQTFLPPRATLCFQGVGELCPVSCVYESTLQCLRRTCCPVFYRAKVWRLCLSETLIHHSVVQIDGQTYPSESADLGKYLSRALAAWLLPGGLLGSELLHNVCAIG